MTGSLSLVTGSILMTMKTTYPEENNLLSLQHQIY